MKYISTRGGIAPIPFQSAVMMGLADDGGLVIPESIPDVSDRLDCWRNLSYADLAYEVFRLFATDIPDADLRELVHRSYVGPFAPEVAPLVKVGDFHVLELFHGPTLAFKDVALQFLGNLFEYVLGHQGGHLNILGATSGDTGSAAICGVRGRDHIDIFIMHPHGRVSPIQERQMTTVLDANVHNIAIRGSFDDCQLIMKDLASDTDFKRRRSLGAVNSINWARVLAQIVYYFHGVFRLLERTDARAAQVCVPTGNFGNVLAGWYARRMGLPIERLVLATNANDILSRFFSSGIYSLGSVSVTLSPAMDIQVASNFERYLFHRLGSDPEQLREAMAEFRRSGSLSVPCDSGDGVDPLFAPGAVSDEATLEVICRYYREYRYLLDPHSAVGVAVAERWVSDDPPLLAIATAHPAKFPDAIRDATGEDLAHHPEIDALRDLPARCVILENDKEAVRRFIEETVQERN